MSLLHLKCNKSLRFLKINLIFYEIRCQVYILDINDAKNMEITFSIYIEPHNFHQRLLKSPLFMKAR